jgi:hypothetical protein
MLGRTRGNVLVVGGYGDRGNALAVSSWGESSNAAGIDGDQSGRSQANAGAVYLYQFASVDSPRPAHSEIPLRPLRQLTDAGVRAQRQLLRRHRRMRHLPVTPILHLLL